MNWLNNFFTNITITNNVKFNDGFISNGDGTYTTTPGLFLYSGTPAAGNLILSITGNTTGHDIFNNNYLADMTEYFNGPGAFNAVNIVGAQIGFFSSPTGNPNAVWTLGGTIRNLNTSGIQVAVGAAPNNAFNLFDLVNTGVSTLFTAASQSGLLFSQAFDGNNYGCGEAFFNGRVNTGINTTGFTALKSIPVFVANLYHVQLRAVYTGDQNAGTPEFSFSHGGVGGSITDAVGVTQVDGANIGVWLNGGISDRTGPTLSTQGHYLLWDMTFTAPSTGSLIFSAAATLAADPWHLHSFDISLRLLS